MRRVARRWLTVAWLVFTFIVAPAFAMHTVTVCQVGPPTCDASTIQEGINLSDNGSTVLVTDSATYIESVVFPGWNLSLECNGATLVPPGPPFLGGPNGITANGASGSGYRVANCTLNGFSTAIDISISSTSSDSPSVVAGNTIRGYGFHAIAMDCLNQAASCSPVTVEDNHALDWNFSANNGAGDPVGISISRFNSSIIRNNTVSNGGARTDSFTGAFYGLHYRGLQGVIDSNTVSDTGGNYGVIGILVDNGEGDILLNNIVRNLTGSNVIGISILTALPDQGFQGHTFRNNTVSGLYATFTVAGIDIGLGDLSRAEGNRIVDLRADVVALGTGFWSGSSVKILNNTVTGLSANLTLGIGLATSDFPAGLSTDGNVLYNNTVSNVSSSATL